MYVQETFFSDKTCTTQLPRYNIYICVSDVVSKEEEVMYFVEGHVIGLFEGVEKRDGRQTKQ